MSEVDAYYQEGQRRQRRWVGAGSIDARPLACADDEATSRAFEATNALGKRVTGTVCCGVVKACTIRW